MLHMKCDMKGSSIEARKSRRWYAPSRRAGRALSSEVERSVCIGEATGSNPVGSTSTFFLFCGKEKTLAKKENGKEKEREKRSRKRKVSVRNALTEKKKNRARKCACGKEKENASLKMRSELNAEFFSRIALTTVHSL